MADYDYSYPDSAERIRWHRKHTGLTQDAYALEIGAKRSQVKEWEAGRARPKPEIAEKMCERYDLSMDFIYRGILTGIPEDLREAWRTRSRS